VFYHQIVFVYMHSVFDRRSSRLKPIASSDDEVEERTGPRINNRIDWTDGQQQRGQCNANVMSIQYV
jgi:hypothetical protein